MKRNLLLFVCCIIFSTCRADSGDSGDGGGFLWFSDDFQADVFNIDPRDVPDGICPCTPRGPICDILATCQRDAGLFEELACAGFEPSDIEILFCGNFPDSFLDFLFTPLFIQTPEFIPFFGGLGICVSSFDGIAGIIRAIIETILEFLDEFDDCFDDRRRRLSFHHENTMKAPDTATATETAPETVGTTTPNPFHGSAVSFENFVQLLEYHGNNRNEVIQMIFKQGGIANLAAMMKQQSQGSGTTTRRLLDSGDSGDDDFGICDFGFLGAFLGGFRRRLQQEFDPTTDAFEALLATLFGSADCDNNRASSPILCLFQDTLDNNRRRLESDDSDDSGDGEDGDDFCCGDISTSIQFTTPDQTDICAVQIAAAFQALDLTELTDGECLS